MQKASWFLLLILLLFAGDRFGGYLLQKQVEKSQFRYSRMYQGRATADILLLGNSRGLTFYQPHIEALSGKSSFNLSYNGLPMDAANVLLCDYLDRYPSPKTLLIDITICDRENDPLLAGFLCYAKYSDRFDDLLHRKMPKIWAGGKVSSLFCFNNELFQRAMYYRNRSDVDWLLDRVIDESMAQRVAANSYDLDVQPYLIQQLKETVSAAQQKGIQVRLLINPYFPGFKVNKLDDLKAAVEHATGLNVSDYRAALEVSEDFGDFMHANKSGSKKYLDILFQAGVFD